MPTGIYIRTAYHISRLKGRKMPPMSEDTKKKIGDAHRGEKSVCFGKISPRNRQVSITCLMCDTIFKVHPYRKNAKYCSRKCLGLSKRNKPAHNRGKHNFKNSGANHWNWKNGATPINQKIRVSLEYKLWRKAVFARDNYKCVWCNKQSGKGEAVILNADHIKPFALYPEYRFLVENGRTLCRDCHKTTDTYANRTR